MQARRWALAILGIVLVSVSLSGAQGEVTEAPLPSVEARLQESYPRWMKEVQEIATAHTHAFAPPLTEYLLQSTAIKEATALGAPALPYLVERAQQEQGAKADFCQLAIGAIMRYRGSWARAGLADWWGNGRQRAAHGYAALLAKWEGALKSREGREVVLWTKQAVYRADLDGVYTHEVAFTPAGEAYKGMEKLGIAVLPYLVDRMRAGHYEFLDIADGLTDSQAQLPDAGSPPKVRAQAFLAWWEQNKQDWIIPWPDEPAAEAPAAATQPAVP